MKWIIRHIPDGMYVVSGRLLIYNSKFACRFSTKKQADAYMTSSGFDRTAYIAEELQVETVNVQQRNTKNVKE
ncbi:hypothetical protein [Ruminococcus sp.]|uniref:hypothetical protein n=1 Tax=Ruminococcus sp. TaxID=41978 RepID=UPI0025EA62C8|nr:hypothetical protein [Ruminococcus sp.]